MLNLKTHRGVTFWIRAIRGPVWQAGPIDSKIKSKSPKHFRTEDKICKSNDASQIFTVAVEICPSYARVSFCRSPFLLVGSQWWMIFSVVPQSLEIVRRIAWIVLIVAGSFDWIWWYFCWNEVEYPLWYQVIACLLNVQLQKQYKICCKQGRISWKWNEIIQTKLEFHEITLVNK